MAYNIDSWKCRKVENLIIPIEALYPQTRVLMTEIIQTKIPHFNLFNL